jgi:integrase
LSRNGVNVKDGLILSNPALRTGKFLPKLPRYYLLLLCAARTGLRMGELLALQWRDIDWHGRFLEVHRKYTHWWVNTPKNGESRRADMSKELGQTLRDLPTERHIEAAAAGREEIPRLGLL